VLSISKQIYVASAGGTVVMLAVRESTFDWKIVVVTVLVILIVEVDVPGKAVASGSVLRILTFCVIRTWKGSLQSRRKNWSRDDDRDYTSGSCYSDGRDSAAVSEIWRSV
jgi:hypothetical protein